jgi:ribosome-associated protein
VNQPDTIRLGQFLKLAGLVDTGGEAKHLIQGGYVTVNGTVETRRKRQLHDGDTVAVGDQEIVVVFEPDGDETPEEQVTS